MADISTLPEDTSLNQSTKFISSNGKVSTVASLEQQIRNDTFTSSLGTADPTKTLDQPASKQLYETIQTQIASLQSNISALNALMIKKDGSVAMTANLDLGSHKMVNLITPTSPTDAVNKDYVDQLIVNQGTVNIAIDAYLYYTASVTSNTIALTNTSGAIPTSYIDGQLVNFICPVNVNVASMLAQIGSLATKPILKGSDLQVTQAGDFQQNYNYTLQYNANDLAGTGAFRLLNPTLAANKTFSGTKNRVINGNFRYWQRNQTFTNVATNAFTSDRWSYIWDGTGGQRTVSRQAFSPGELEGPGLFAPYYSRTQQTLAGTGATFNTLKQTIEDVRTFAGQVVTLSFYCRFVTGVNTITGDIKQYFGTGGSPSATIPLPFTFTNVGTGWTRCSVSISVPSISGKILGTNNDHGLIISLVQPLNQTFTFDLAYVQLEAGSVATPFEYRNDQQELALCQRYYEKSYELDTLPGTAVSQATAGIVPSSPGQHLFEGSGSAATTSVSFRVQKRTVPTVTIYNPVTGAGNSARSYDPGSNRTINSSFSSTSNIALEISNDLTSGAGVTNGLHWVVEAEL